MWRLQNDVATLLNEWANEKLNSNITRNPRIVELLGVQMGLPVGLAMKRCLRVFAKQKN
jgi:hypothetical protein